MTEYVEKSSPMLFPSIPKVGSPMDESTPPMGVRGERPSDQNYGERPSDQNYGERPSDQNYGERPSDQNYGERPSDQNVRSAVEALLELTACECGNYGDPHLAGCVGDYRGDVVVLVAAAGWTAPGARVRERYV